ncbi:hypothetical protein [Draconibacterium halophilum]|uniref:Uncharacterized protein n=1 Tax=Draconibacterium halophilum TaxID=2706887 RepID=A0A6C0RGU7_9BACT|nr:hypothetical protein [Draconibacterium halophilum]QIA09267.1 hypothetical protein G0Q07_16800 [Draconibacterium halophilum]
MKKVVFISVAMLMVSLLGFSQAKYQPKVVVLFMGEKNPTFDESKFPDCEFYYTPGITAEEKKAKTVASAGLGALGIKGTERDYDIDFSGTPEEAYATNICEAVFFDKNGNVSGLFRSAKNVCTSPKKNLKGSMDFVNYDSFSKDYIKKEKTTKAAKKAPKKPKHLFDYYGSGFPADFEVVNANGEKAMVSELVTGNPLTLFYCLYLSPGIDLAAGMESGNEKKGTDYINDNINTVKGIKKLSLLSDIEYDIFGNKVVW